MLGTNRIRPVSGWYRRRMLGCPGEVDTDAEQDPGAPTGHGTLKIAAEGYLLARNAEAWATSHPTSSGQGPGSGAGFTGAAEVVTPHGVHTTPFTL